jgi:hypothetical protein
MSADADAPPICDFNFVLVPRALSGHFGLGPAPGLPGCLIRVRLALSSQGLRRLAADLPPRIPISRRG